MPGIINNNYFYFIQYSFVFLILFYLLIIIYKKYWSFIKKSLFKKKVNLLYIFKPRNFILSHFYSKLLIIIKYYTYLFPFYFYFFHLIKKESINKFYLILASTFFIYKYSTFNDGVGRYDSFPSIIDIKLKKEVIWDDPNLYKLKIVNRLIISENNYIIKAYLNLKLVD